MYLARQQDIGVVQQKGQTRRRSPLVAMIAAMAFAATGMAAPISVPNGDFSVTANDGHIGGGVLGGSGTGLIGSGPWGGTYQGVAGLLAPPLLTIGPGHATVGGLAGVNVLSILDNSGSFNQVLATPYEASHHYILSATVDAGVPLNVGVLNDGNAGIALTDGLTQLASTTGSNAGTLVSLSLLNGTTYKLVLTYDTGATVSGHGIGVELFAQPQNLVTLNLLTSISFSNVSLSGSMLNPVAASIAPASGTPQGAQVNQPFAAPLVVTVLDSEGDPVSGATVTFSAPTSGASANLSATTVTTDASGNAQVTGTANGTAGSYIVTASVSGAGSAQFALTNLPGGATSIGNATGTPQSATVNTSFTTPLGVTVTDADGNPVPGITVVFVAPATGASASFPNGINTATTDANGQASIDASANTIAGPYVITATVAGGTTQASFSLDNLPGPAAVATPLSGTPQTATVSTAFNVPLSLKLTDAYGNPVVAADVTFTAPTTGASATFGSNGDTVTVMTDADGIASVDATANATAGSYLVTVSTPGLSTNTAFSLANTDQEVPISVTTSGQGQDTNVTAAFSCLLQLHVTYQDGTPVISTAVAFTAPASGPSATLSSGSDSGQQVTVLTDNNGLAGVTATANGTPGTYDISAAMVSNDWPLASYTLNNLDAGDDLFREDFENWPALCPNP